MNKYSMMEMDYFLKNVCSILACSKVETKWAPSMDVTLDRLDWQMDYEILFKIEIEKTIRNGR